VELIRELQAREAEIRATLYSIGDGVISTDSKGNILVMNPIAENSPAGRRAKPGAGPSRKSSKL